MVLPTDPSGYDTESSNAQALAILCPQAFGRSTTDVFAKVEGSASSGGVNVSVSVGGTSAPAVFGQVSITYGAGAGASGGVGGGVLVPNKGSTTSGIVKGASTGASFSYGPGLEHSSNSSGSQTAVTLSTPTQGQGGIGGSYGFFYLGAPGASGASSSPTTGCTPLSKPPPT